MTTPNEGSALPQSNPVDSTENTNGKVSYETYSKVLAEAKKAKELARELAQEKARVEESKLKEQNEWKQLAEQYKSQLDNTSKTLEEQERSITTGRKFQEFEKHLGGKLKKQDYATFIDFEKIAMNPETKTVDPESVKTVVNEFLKEHSSLVDFGSPGKMPNGGGASFASRGATDLSAMTKEELEKHILSLGDKFK